MRKKTFLFLIILPLLLSLSVIVVANPVIVEIQTKMVIEDDLPYTGTYSLYFKNNKIFYSKYEYCTIVDLDDLSIVTVDPETDFFRILGVYGDRFLVKKNYPVDPDREYFYSLYTYSPETFKVELYDLNPEIKSHEHYINHFINSLFFFTIAQGEGHTSYFYNMETGEKSGHFPGRLADLSPDRIHSLWAVPNQGIYLYNHYNKEWVSTRAIVSAEIDNSSIPNIYFINNDLFMFGNYIFNLDGEKLVKFVYLPDKFYSNVVYLFPIRDSEYGYFNYFGNGIVHRYGEAESLEDFGLLFKPTTGIANDSRVRIREYALLEAKNLGYLTAGDKLEILDRSGIKVKIGDMEDYWYKLRRVSDGMEGWSYGAFIDVDEPPEMVDDGSPKSYRILDEDPSEYVHPRDR